MNFDIIPKKSVGPFQFGVSIKSYKLRYPFSFIKAEFEDDWDTYIFFDDEVNVYTDPGKNIIESISLISDTIYLNGISLVKENINDVLINLEIDINSLIKEEIHLSDDVSQMVYDIDELGVQLWVNNKNIIEKVFCNNGD